MAKYLVTMKRRVGKAMAKMPVAEQDKLARILDLTASGPVQPRWMNYGKLSSSEYHCHLSYHWVACWRHEAGTIEIEVSYAGSRENAPY